MAVDTPLKRSSAVAFGLPFGRSLPFPDGSGANVIGERASVAYSYGSLFPQPIPGYRSLLAPWMGGVSVSPGAVAATHPGFRSLLAPWMGGVSVSPEVIPTGAVSFTIYRPVWRIRRR